MAPIICTGFHRSGTSLVAQLLAQSGLSMGPDLAAASISNTEGHYEDTGAVTIHETLLRRVNSSWQFHDEVTLPGNHTIFELLKPYLERRALEGPTWGIKDPRLCLFLPQWAHLLPHETVFILVFRHWQSCVQSLWLRHSRELALDTPVGTALREHLAFWHNPALAARMWLSYNQRLLAFARQSSHKVVLIASEQLIADPTSWQALSNVTNLPLCDARDLIKPQHYQHSINQSIFTGIDTRLESQLNTLYHQLLRTSGITAPPKINQTDFHESSKRLAKVLQSNLLSATPTKAKPAPQGFTWPALQQLQQMLPFGPGTNTEEVTSLIAQLPSESCNYYLWQGRLQLHLQQWQQAVDSLSHCNEQFEPTPQAAMLLGDAYLGMADIQHARTAYKAAISLNSKHAEAHMRLAQLATQQHDFDSAINHLQYAITAAPKSPKFQSALLRLQADTKGSCAALQTAQALWQSHHLIETGNYYANLMFQAGHTDARSVYHDVHRQHLLHSDLLSWLRHLAKALNPQCLATLLPWLTQHWIDLFNNDDEALAKLLQQYNASR